MIRGINHTAINTHDLARLADFYTKVIGFEEAADPFSWRDNAVIDSIFGLTGTAAQQRMLRAGNCFLELFEFETPSARDGGPLRACDHGFTHLALDVTNIDAEVDTLRSRGMVFLLERPIALGELRAIYGKDPDGNLIELIQTTDEHPYSLAQLTRRKAK